MDKLFKFLFATLVLNPAYALLRGFVFFKIYAWYVVAVVGAPMYSLWAFVGVGLILSLIGQHNFLSQAKAEVKETTMTERFFYVGATYGLTLFTAFLIKVLFL